MGTFENSVYELGKLVDLSLTPSTAERIRKFTERLKKMKFVDGNLHCYASGDGALHLTWKDSDNREPITKKLAEKYLKSEQAKHLRQNGWVVNKHANGYWGFVRPVEFIDDHTLKIAGESDVFNYIANSKNGDYFDCDLTITYNPEGFDGPVEVKNLSIRAVVLYALRNRVR